MKTPVVCKKCNSVCYSEVGLCRECKPRAVRDCSAEYKRLIARLKASGLYERFRQSNNARYGEYNRQYRIENRDRINATRREAYRAKHPFVERTKKPRKSKAMYGLPYHEVFTYTKKPDPMPIQVTLERDSIGNVI